MASFLEGEGAAVLSRVAKPEDSLIESYVEADSLGFIIPASGFTLKTLFFIFFSLFWNGVSWTIFGGAINEGEVFGVLFSIPFILIGIATFGMFLYSWKGVFSLLVDREKCYAVWSVFSFKYRKTARVKDISDIVETVLYTQNHQSVYGINVKYGKKKNLKFGSTMTEDERKWCIGEMKHFVNNVNPKLSL